MARHGPASPLRLPWLSSLLLLCGLMPACAEPGDTDLGNRLKATPNDVHALIIDETADVLRQGTTGQVIVTSQPAGVSIRPTRSGENGPPKPPTAIYTSRVIHTDFPFNEVVPSWNVDVPAGGGFTVELRVGRRKDDFWTPYYYLGTWGSAASVDQRTVKDSSGAIHVDYFRSDRCFDRVQYRVRLAASDTDHSPVLRRFTLACSNTLDDEALARRRRKPIDPGPKARWARRLPVPFRTQKTDEPRLQGQICSATCVSMVMAYRGVDKSPAALADIIYDPEYKIFGNWARAIQAAYTLGVPGYIERFSDWDAVKRHIANDQPIIASIRVAPGQLRGAPYRHSEGHLFVIVGFDEAGNVHVNDPAFATAAEGMLTYSRDDMTAVWLANGGIGLILLPATTTR